LETRVGKETTKFVRLRFQRNGAGTQAKEGKMSKSMDPSAVLDPAEGENDLH
jgi:hypothetical protein